MLIKNNKKFTGLIYALIVLIGNGIHPIINNTRPSDLNALNFVFQMSFVEFLGALIIFFIEKQRNLKKLDEMGELKLQAKNFNKKTISKILLIGVIFSIATYLYVLGLSLAGAINGSIALKISPIYAMIIGSIFLKEKLDYRQILLTFFILAGLYYLGTEGTCQINLFSSGFAILLFVPFLWIVGHAITKPLMRKNKISPPQIIIYRTGIVFSSIFVIALIKNGWQNVLSSILNPEYLFFSFLMGFIYLLMHYAWYSSINLISLSFASALVTPSPVITTILAIMILGDNFYIYHIIGMSIIIIGLYLMIFLKIKEKK